MSHVESEQLPFFVRLMNAAGLLFAALVFLLFLFVLAGCDADFERMRNRAKVNERIRLNCMPMGDERVVVGWFNGKLVCHSYTPSNYSAAVEHRSVVVATREEYQD